MQDIYKIENYIFEKTISWTTIKQRILELATRINTDYSGKEPIFLVAMKGAMFFAIELLKEISLPCTIEVISAKSYGNEMQSAGKVSVFYNNFNLANKDVIVVEDIVDTGYTIDKLLNIINAQSPQSVAIATLLTKPAKLCVEVKIDYWGFAIEPEFVIGCGLDYKEYGRNLRGIYQLKSSN